MREIVDEVDFKELGGGFKILFKHLQKNKKLPVFQSYKDYYLLAIDGTEYVGPQPLSILVAKFRFEMQRREIL